MTKIKKTSNGTTKRIRALARIISTPMILYALVMVIGYGYNWITTGVADPYTTNNYPFIENFPPFLLLFAIIGLAVAWRWERIGGIINLFFCAATLIVLPFAGMDVQEFRSWFPMILVLIIALPGVLFLSHYYKYKKSESSRVI